MSVGKYVIIRGFHKLDIILVIEPLLRKNKNFQQQNVTSSEDWPWDLWFQVCHSPYWANLACAT